MGLRYVRRQTGRIERSKRVLQAQRRDELHRLLPRVVPPNRQRLILAFDFLHQEHLPRRRIVPWPRNRPVRAAVGVERCHELDDVVREFVPSSEDQKFSGVRLMTDARQYWFLARGEEV